MSHFRPAGNEVQNAARHAGFQRQSHRGGGNERRLRRGLGDDGVAGAQSRGDLAEEDGEREVPRADAGDDAASGEAEARSARQSVPEAGIGAPCLRASTA